MIIICPKFQFPSLFVRYCPNYMNFRMKITQELCSELLSLTSGEEAQKKLSIRNLHCKLHVPGT